VKTILLISPYFPPMNVIGSKRALNLARHLPSRGFRAVVLAAPIDGEARDPRLLELLPHDLAVSYAFAGPLRRRRSRGSAPPALPRSGGRTRSRGDRGARALASRFRLAMSFVSPFDKLVGGVPAAIRAGLALVARHEPRIVHVNADPWSGVLAGVGIARAARLPLVVDMRDPWALHDFKRAARFAPARWATDLAELACLAPADRIVLNTRAACDAYRARYRAVIPPERFDFVRNAFDPDVYEGYRPEVTPRSPEDPFVVLYFGSLRLTVSAQVLLDGFGAWVRRRGLSPAAARLAFVGKVEARDLEAVRRSGLAPYVDVRPAVSIREAMPILRDADVLVALNPPGYRLTVPGKLYDYFASGRPIVVVASNEEIGELLASVGAGEATPWADPRLPECFDRVYRARARGSLPTDLAARAGRFAVDHQVDAFARIYDELLAGR